MSPGSGISKSGVPRVDIVSARVAAGASRKASSSLENFAVGSGLGDNGITQPLRTTINAQAKNFVTRSCHESSRGTGKASMTWRSVARLIGMNSKDAHGWEIVEFARSQPRSHERGHGKGNG